MAPKRRMARPAAAKAVPRRRPAANVPRVSEVAKPLTGVGLADVAGLGLVKLPNAVYYHRPVVLAGEFKGVKVEAGEAFGEMEVTGTKDDELLRVLSGQRGKKMRVHFCTGACHDTLTGDTLVHGKDFVQVKTGQEDWYENLKEVVERTEKEVDELEKLRKEAERQANEAEDGKEKEKTKAEKKKDKKEKQKEKKKEKASSSKKKRKIEEDTDDSSEVLEVGQKALKALFEGTGLDPSLKRRSKVLKRARRVGKSKKKKKKKEEGEEGSEDTPSGSSSSSSSTTDVMAEGGLFDTGKKIKVMAAKYPGALTCNSLNEARQVLLTSSGTTWQLDRKQLPPLFTQYVRQQLATSMGAPMLQEALTLAFAVDSLLQGRPAFCCDLLSQRLKSLETSARGAHWSVGRQHELLNNQQGLLEDAENLEAAKKAREEERLKALMGRNSGKGRDADGGKSRKGKDNKGSNKGNQDGGGKGRYDGRKGDKSGGWQNEKKDK